LRRLSPPKLTEYVLLVLSAAFSLVMTLDGWEMCTKKFRVIRSSSTKEQFAPKNFIMFQIVKESKADSLAIKYFVRQTGLPYPDLSDKVAVANSHLTTRDQSLTTSILSADTFFGTIIAGDIADFVGRRVTIIAGCLIFSIGCVLETATSGLALMVVGRVIAGFGVGFTSGIVILYM